MSKRKAPKSRLKLVRMENKNPQPRGKETYVWHRECEYIDTVTRKRHMFMVMEIPIYCLLTWRVELWAWHTQSRKWICQSGEYCTSERWKVEATISNWIEELEDGLWD